VLVHLPAGEHREKCVRASVRDAREVLRRRSVVVVDERPERLTVEVVSREQHDRGRVACVDRPHRVLEKLDAGGAAVAVVHQPARPETELPREIDRAVGRQRERGDTETVDLLAPDAGVREHANERIGEQ